MIAEKLPFLLLGAAAGCATLLAQQGAIQAVQRLSFPARIANAVVSYAVYLGQMFKPSGLAVHYPHPKDQLSVWTVVSCAVVLLIVTAGVVRWQRKRPYLLVGWLWYLGMLVPVIGVLQVGSQAHADRYTYLPQIGLLVMASWGAADLCGSWRCSRAVLPVTAAMILTASLALSYAQTATWRDSVSLWAHALARTAANSRTRNNLGAALARQGKWHEAVEHYEAALQLKPDYALAHANLGTALAAQGKYDEALRHYETALRIKPDDADARLRLGLTLSARGRPDEAVHHYERLLQLQPDHAEAHYNLGVLLAAQRRFDAAVHHYERALGINPNNGKARNNLGSALAALGKFDAAIQCYEQALQLDPDLAEAHANLGLRLAEQGQTVEALRHFQRAVDLATTQANPALAEAVGARIKAAQTPAPRTGTP